MSPGRGTRIHCGLSSAVPWPSSHTSSIAINRIPPCELPRSAGKRITGEVNWQQYGFDRSVPQTLAAGLTPVAEPGHFFRVAAQAMRHIPINYAERRRTAKRGTGCWFPAEGVDSSWPRALGGRESGVPGSTGARSRRNSGASGARRVGEDVTGLRGVEAVDGWRAARRRRRRVGIRRRAPRAGMEEEVHARGRCPGCMKLTRLC